MDNAVIAAMAAALAAEEEAGGLPANREEGRGLAGRPAAIGRGSHAGSVSSQDSVSYENPALLALMRSNSIPTKYFIGKGVSVSWTVFRTQIWIRPDPKYLVSRIRILTFFTSKLEISFKIVLKVSKLSKFIISYPILEK